MKTRAELEKEGWEAVPQSRQQLEAEGWEPDVSQMQHQGSSGSGLSKEEEVALAFRRLYGTEPQGRLGGNVAEPFLRGLGAVDERDATLRWMEDRFPGIQANSVNVGGDTYYAGLVPGEETPRYLNPPGLDVGDVSHMVGSILPETFAGLLKGPAKGIGKLLFGGPGRRAAFGEAAQQLGQAAYDPASQNLQRSGQEVALSGVSEAVPAWAMTRLRGPANFAAGKGWTTDPFTRQSLLDIDAARKVGIDIPIPMPQQISRNQVLKTTADQAAATNKILQDEIMLNRQLLRETAEDVPGLLKAARENTGQQIKDIGVSAADRRSMQYRGPVISQEFSGKQFVDAASSAQQGDWAMLGRQYKALDKLAEQTKPVFDLSRAKGISERTGVYGLKTEEVPGSIVDVKGKPLTVDLVRNYLNVADTPQGRVARVARLIDELDAGQVDYKVIKELRTQVGSAIENMPWENDRANGIAKKVYGELSEVLKNPVSGGSEFAKAFSNVNKSAVKYYDMVGDQKFRQILQNSDNLANLSNEFLNNPANINKTTRDILERMPRQRENLRLDMTSRILNSQGGALRAIDDLKRSNVDAFNFMFPSKQQQDYVARLASLVDEWQASPIRQALSANADRVSIGKELLNNNALDTRRADELLSMFGGKGTRGHELLRVAAMDNLLDAATITTPRGEMVLDAKAMHEAINKMDKSGVWETILTGNDKVRLRGIAGALRVGAESAGDVGTSLQRASAVANLRHPATFLKGLHTLAGNKAIAYMLANPTVGNYYFKAALGKGGDVLSTRTLQNIGVLIGSTSKYVMDLNSQ